MKPASVAYRAVALASSLAVAALVFPQLMTLLLAVMLTVIFALPLSAAATSLQRRGVPRIAGVLAALLVVGALIGAIVLLIVPQFVTQAQDLAKRLPAIVVSVEHSLHLRSSKPPTLAHELSTAIRSLIAHPNRLGSSTLQFVGNVLGTVTMLVLILLAATLIALNPEPLLAGVLRLVPAGHRARARDVFGRIRTAWLGWLTAIGIDMLVLGGLLFAGLTIVGLPFALGFAAFSALMTVIPNYGSIISAIPPVLVGLADSPSKGLLVLLVYVIVNQIEGNLILPLVMARTLDIHPALVTIGVVVMSSLFGLIGLLISVPLLSLAIILVEAVWVEPLEGRPLPPSPGRDPPISSTHAATGVRLEG